MHFFCIGGLENAILLYRGGLENAIYLYRGSPKCHFLYMGVSKIGKISSPPRASPFLNGLDLINLRWVSSITYQKPA